MFEKKYILKGRVLCKLKVFITSKVLITTSHLEISNVQPRPAIIIDSINVILKNYEEESSLRITYLCVCIHIQGMLQGSVQCPLLHVVMHASSCMEEPFWSS